MRLFIISAFGVAALVVLPYHIQHIQALSKEHGGFISAETANSQVYGKASLEDMHRDCGPLCLMFICQMYGIDLPLDEARSLCRTSAAGTSLLDIKKAAGSLGLVATGGKLSPGELPGLQVPGIIRVAAGASRTDAHFVVLWGRTGSDLILVNPPYSVQICAPKRLAPFWDGNALLIYPSKVNPPVSLVGLSLVIASALALSIVIVRFSRSRKLRR